MAFVFSVWACPYGPGCGGMVRALRSLRFTARPSVQSALGALRSPEGPAIPHASRCFLVTSFHTCTHSVGQPPLPAMRGPLLGAAELVPA